MVAVLVILAELVQEPGMGQVRVQVLGGGLKASHAR